MKNGFKAGIGKRGVSLFLIPLLLQFLIAQEALAFVGAPAMPLPSIESFQELSSFVPQKILQKDKRDKEPFATTLFLALLHLGLRMDLVAFVPVPSLSGFPLGPIGNLTGRGSDTLSYDSENRLKEITAYEGTTNTQSYTLKPGWNVVSFTWLPDNKLVSNILSSLVFGTDYDQVSTWDSASSSWKHWVNDPDFNDFTEFARGKTYEIYNKTAVDKTFSVTGKSSGPDISHSIVSGDNFISPAVKTATNVSTVLGSLVLGTHYSDVKRFNATSQTWESYASSQFTQFEPGKGYNIIGLTTASFSYGNTQQATTFIYDSTGSRIKKTSGSTTTVYFGKDYEVEGNTSTKHLFLGDRRISTKKYDGSTHTTEYIHGDHINSSNIITDSSGNQSGLIEYDPYGTTVTQTGSANPKHKFTGQEEDTTTHLYYYGRRYYDPQIGRFISADWLVQDPKDPQSLNRYAYARNNPIIFIDPTGNFFWFIGLAIAAIAQAAAAVASAAVAVISTIASAVAGALHAIGSAILGGLQALASAGANALPAGANITMGAGTAAVDGVVITGTVAPSAVAASSGLAEFLVGTAAVASITATSLAAPLSSQSQYTNAIHTGQALSTGSINLDSFVDAAVRGTAGGPHPNLNPQGSGSGGNGNFPLFGGEGVAVFVAGVAAHVVSQAQVVSENPVLREANDKRAVRKGRSTGEKIKDINENPQDWEKVGERPDSKQPKGGKSIRELWRNKLTDELLEKHVLEREGGSAKGHPHYHEPKS